MARRMPAEWSAHERLWIGFPGDPAEWPVALAAAQRQVAAFADAVRDDGRGEAVTLVARTPEDAATARALVRPDVEVAVEAFGDIWLRDTGPIAVSTPQGQRLVGFGFNGWGGEFRMPGDDMIAERLAARTSRPLDRKDWILEGGAIDTDGTGLFVTTEQCLLNPNRNPALSRTDIEARLSDAIGLTGMLWLGDGLTGDHTDGHVDNLARFVAPGIMALPVATTDDDPNAGIFADARGRIAAHGLTVVEMPSVGRHMIDGAVAPASYMNFLVANEVVVVPQYGAANDGAALGALRDLFPHRRVVGLASDALLRGGGSFHCCSQQLPLHAPGPDAP